jgi:dipeptidyl aminopeptidase/acylaminoacyl peptidase
MPDAPLIPRELLFDNPTHTYPTISPDGKRLAWLAPDSNNIIQLWIKTRSQNDERILTKNKRRIFDYAWAYDNNTILFTQDGDGDENFHLHGIDLSTGAIRDYTPFPRVRVNSYHLDPNHPHSLMIEANQRDPARFDLYLLNLQTGELQLDALNPGDVGNFLPGPEQTARLAYVCTPDGGIEIRHRPAKHAPWKPLLTAGLMDDLNPLLVTADGQSALFLSNVNRNTLALIQKHLTTGEETLLHASDVDVFETLINPKTRTVDAVAYAPDRTRWHAVNPALESDLASAAKILDGDFILLSRTLADDLWLLRVESDRFALRYYLWNRKSKSAEFLFAAFPALDQFQLAPMQHVVIKTRDNLDMHAYLTLPTHLPHKNLPLVLHPHGGPAHRDTWGYDTHAQFLANRGYAVLQPNFRGSTGYNKQFFNAGIRQWGKKMHDDLIDALQWAVDQKIADPTRVATFGYSYGGYCALASLTFTPETFTCAICGLGPSDIKTLLQTVPPYWTAYRAALYLRVGNPDDPADAQHFIENSPLYSAHRICRPLLIATCGNDPRMPVDQSERIVDAIAQNNGSVSYILYPDEGHRFDRPENFLDFAARAETFLSKHLGGRCEPKVADIHPGSSAIVRNVGEP